MKILMKLIAFTVAIFTLFLIFDFAFPLNLGSKLTDESKIIYAQNGEILNMSLNKNGIWFIKANNKEIPKRVKQSVIFFEDRYYNYHFGVNFFSVLRAAFHNLTHKNRIGASSISMQVARMLNPKERSYKNKIIEIFNAFQLEFHYSKDEILQMYLNLAPYGGNLQGIKTASLFYFGKNLDDLTNAQIALLCVIPKNPNKNRLDKISNISKLKNSLITKLYEAEILTKSEFLRAKKENFKNKRLSAPNFAPNFAQIAFKNGISHTNLNLKFQKKLEQLLKFEIEKLSSKNVKNAAAVLIDNKKMQVVAYVASHDLKAKNGQNDGVKSIKNVGSTLKPFIYAKALEKGLITPKSKLVDTQLYYKNYTPKNYFDDFVGIVRAKDALTYSLNIPALKLNSILGEDSLYFMLKRADLTEYDEEFYGNGIALGGISLSLLDLTHLYTIFANGGKLLPLEIAGEKIDKNISILTPQSTYLTYLMLEQTPRNYLNSVWKNTKNKPHIMFKTGTSADSKDLYTIGVSKDFTLGVWLGNFDGSKTDDLSGGISAAEVVLNMFEYLDKISPQKQIEKPNGIFEEKVCCDAYINESCNDFQNDFVITKFHRDCDFYRPEELFFMFKNGYLNQNDIKNTPCFNEFSSIRPVLNEIDGKNYKTDKKLLRLKISCTAVFGDEVFISIDDEKYISFPNGKDIFYSFKKGAHTIKCLDIYSNLSVAEFSTDSL